MACLRLREANDRYTSCILIRMKTNLLKSLLGAALLAGLAIGANAQTTPPTTLPPTAPAIGKLGPELRAIIAVHRDVLKTLLEQRKATLAALKNATPDQIATLRATLREIMKETQQEQRDLAREIRIAIKARRDLQHKPAGG